MRGRKNWVCPCGCGSNSMDYELHGMIAYIEGHYKKEISIHSGARCHSHNKTVGGSTGSQHLKFKAVDFHIIGVTNKDVYNMLNKFNPNCFGVIHYKWGIHFDVRDIPYRSIK